MQRLRLLHWIEAEWKTVCFVVALLTVLHHVGVFQPVSRLSLLILLAAQSQLGGASPTAASTATAWVLVIDDDHFVGAYDERRPLRRCALVADLRRILEKHPPVLVVDLDLSPLANETSDETRCQHTLDMLIDDEAKETRIVLLRPFGTVNAALRDRKSAWMQARKEVAFADGDVDLAPGLRVAVETLCNPSGLAETAFRVAASAPAGGTVDEPCRGREHDEPLNYRAYRANVFAQSISRVAAIEPSMHDKTVFFGTWTARSDRMLTPIGAFSGVFVHAVRWATLGSPYHDMRRINLLADLAFATAFASIVSVFASRYVAAGRPRSPSTPGRRMCIMIAFSVAFALAAVMALALAAVAVASGNIITEPLLIALGLAFDGFVLAGWGHIDPHDAQGGHGLHGPRAWWSDLSAIARESPSLAALEVGRWAVFWGVLGLAVVLTFEGGGTA